MDTSALLFLRKYLFTILTITFEPFELFSYVTTHLKAKDLLYKGHVTFFTLENSGKIVYVPKLVVNVC